MDPLPQNAVLLIVDVQQGLDDPALGPRNNPAAEQTMAQILTAWRQSGRPVIHVQHLSTRPDSPLHPSRPGVAIKPEVAPLPEEVLIRKQVNSAFIGTDLEARLRAAGCENLVIMGLTTPHCISTTARMAGNLGFQTILVADATAAHAAVGYDGQPYSAEEIHQVALAALHNEFATVVESDAVLQALA